MGQAADPVDGRADLRLAGQVPPPEQGPREERPVVGIVHQAGHDPVDVSPASPLRCGRRIPLSRCSLNRPYGTVTYRTAMPTPSRSGSTSIRASKSLAGTVRRLMRKQPQKPRPKPDRLPIVGTC